MRLEVADRVLDFIRLLAPQPRRELRLALRHLANGRGDTKALQGELVGYWRLRVMTYRVIFRYETLSDERIVRCVYMAPRSIVYPRFQQLHLELTPPRS